MIHHITQLQSDRIDCYTIYITLTFLCIILGMYILLFYTFIHRKYIPTTTQTPSLLSIYYIDHVTLKLGDIIDHGTLKLSDIHITVVSNFMLSFAGLK